MSLPLTHQNKLVDNSYNGISASKIIFKNVATINMVNILQMYMNRIVIGTDFRGRGLREYISRSNYFPQSHIHHGIFPGGNFKHASPKTLQQVDRISRQNKSASIYCYAGAGICNLTTKSRSLHGSNINYVQSYKNIADFKQDVVNYHHTAHKNGIMQNQPYATSFVICI